jgi:ankyrin repeat protein
VTGSDALAHLSLSTARSFGIPLGDRDLDNAIRADLRPGGQHLRVVTRLVDAMRDLDDRGSDGSTLLHQVTGSAGGDLSERERCAFVMVLIERGARLDIRDARTDATPLACAARHGQRHVVELLLARGALPNDAPRRTPLEWALASQRLDIADLLRSHGASEPTP